MHVVRSWKNFEYRFTFFGNIFDVSSRLARRFLSWLVFNVHSIKQTGTIPVDGGGVPCFKGLKNVNLHHGGERTATVTISFSRLPCTWPKYKTRCIQASCISLPEVAPMFGDRGSRLRGVSVLAEKINHAKGNQGFMQLCFPKLLNCRDGVMSRSGVWTLYCRSWSCKFWPNLALVAKVVSLAKVCCGRVYNKIRGRG